MRTLLLALLLSATAYAATIPFDEAGCTRFYTDTSPDTVLTWKSPCDTATLRTTGDTYVPDTSRPSTGWKLGAVSGGGCGDGSVNQTNEQCDAPGGVGSVGSCGTVANCGADCRCLSPTCGTAADCPGGATAMDCISSVCVSKCGNGVVDGTEGCDLSDDGSPCQGVWTNPATQQIEPRCTSACKCNPTCGDGTLQTGTPGGTATDENCEFPPATSVSFDNAANFARNACGSSNNGCATIREPSNRSTWDFTGATAFTAMVKFRLTTLAATQRLLFNGGNNDTTPGWLVEVTSANKLSGAFSPTTAADTNTTTMLSATTLATGQKYTGFLVKQADGTSVALYLSNPTSGVVALEDSDTITSLTNGSSQQFTVGGAASSSGGFQGDYVDDVAVWNRALTEAEMNQLVQNEASASSSGIVLLLDFSEAVGSTLVTDKSATAAQFLMCNGADAVNIANPCNSTGTGCTVNCTGTVTLAASPWTTSTGGGITEDCSATCGCTAPQVCNTGSCRCQDPETSGGRTFYVSTAAGASNSNYPCTSSSLPCRDGNYVLDETRAQPGDRVIFKNNADGAPHSNLRLICGSSASFGSCNGTGATTVCGTSTQPITLECETERQCAWVENGDDQPLEISGCQWFRFKGLAMRSANNLTNPLEGVVVKMTFVKNLEFERNLWAENNSCENNHVVDVQEASDILFLENECSENSRHCIRRNGSQRVNTRRNYFSNRGRTYDCSGGPGSPPGGTSQEQSSHYIANDCIDENDLYEGSDGGGDQGHGGNGVGGIRGSSNNKVYGEIMAGVEIGMKYESRPTDPRGIAFNDFQDILLLSVGPSFGIRNSVTVGHTYNRITAINGTIEGMRVDDPGASSSQLTCAQLTAGPASVTLSNSVFTGNSGASADVVFNDCDGGALLTCTLTNISADDMGGTAITAACETSSQAGSGNTCGCSGNNTTIPTILGTTGADKCVVYTNTSRGADIRCKYENGVKLSTATNNLWWATGDTTPGGTAITTDAGCSATPPAGPTQGCRGGFKGCGATRTGWNDGTENCRSFAQRKLNHQADLGGCGNSAATSFACP